MKSTVCIPGGNWSLGVFRGDMFAPPFKDRASIFDMSCSVRRYCARAVVLAAKLQALLRFVSLQYCRANNIIISPKNFISSFRLLFFEFLCTRLKAVN